MKNNSLKETYNKIAEDWHKEVRSKDWWEPVVKKLMSSLKKGDLVLDVGCGPGILSKYFFNKEFNVVGIDFSEKMIEIARREVPRGKFLVLDIDNIEEIKEEFDAILMKAVLLHVPKKEVQDKLKNVVKLLKNGGYIYIAVKEKRPGGPEEEMKVDNDYGYEIKRFFSYFTVEEIKEHLNNLDFEVVSFEITPAGRTSWIQVIAKKI